MKTAKWCHNLLLSLCLAGAAPAATFIALEGDLRGTVTGKDGADAEVNAIGGSVRKVIDDAKGDRWILFLQAETDHNFSELMLRQAYGELKGPMGKWNVALGRVPLPWGLLTDWSPDRMPYTSPYSSARMLESDNGILFKGTREMLDYGLSLTQGYGMDKIQNFPGPGNLTGRIGVNPDLEGRFNFGFSGSAGTVFVSEDGHGRGHVTEEKRAALALDCTLNLGRGIYRIEGGGRKTEEKWHGTVFAAADYALFTRMALQTAGQLYTGEDHGACGWLYAGISVPMNLFTIRGGYEYENKPTDDHRVVVQLYCYFAVARP